MELLGQILLQRITGWGGAHYSLLQAQDWTGTATQVERKHYDPVILEFYWSISFF